MRVLLRDLAPNQTYGVQFRLAGRGMASDWSPIVRFTTDSDVLAPANVTGLTVTPIGTAFEVKWNKVTTNTDGSALGDFKDYQVAITAGGVTRTWFVTGERFDFPIEVNTNAFGTPQASISVSVSARDNNLNIADSAPSVSANNAAPPAPANFAPRQTVNGVNFTWDKVSISDLKYYRIYMGASAGAINTLLYEGPSNNFTWSSIDFTTTYYFKVASVDVFNQEALSASVSATALGFDGLDKTPPANPTWPASWFDSETDLSNKYSPVANVTLTWNANGETDLGSYIVRYKKSADSVWSQVRVSGTSTTPPTATVKIYGLVPNTAYNFEVAAADKSGNTSGFVAAPASGTTTRDTTPPAIPSTPVISAYMGLVNVAWNGLSSTGSAMSSDVSNIEVHVSQTTGFTPSTSTLASVMNATGGPNKTLLAELPYGVPHYIKFIAVDFAGNKSTASAQQTGTAVRLTATDIPDIATAQGVADSALTAANGKNKSIFSLNNATGTTGYVEGDMWFKKNASNVILAQWEFTGGAWVTKTMDSAVIANLDAAKIVAGTITTDKMTANTINGDRIQAATLTVGKIKTGEIAAGQRIIAGSELGPHAEMTSDGFRTYSINQATGQVYEVTKMGTSTDDTLTITDAAGAIKAAMDVSGKIVGRGLSINGPTALSEWPQIAGKSLLTSMNERPRGIQVWGPVAGGNVNTVAERGDALWTFWADPGRMYQVSLGPVQVFSTAAGDWVQVAIRYTTDGTDPSPSSPYVAYALAQHNGTLQINSLFQVSGTPGTPVQVKLLMTHARNFGTGSTTIGSAGGYMCVTDVGYAPSSGTITGAAPLPPALQTYTTDFAPTWWSNWRGNDSLIDMGNDVYQGYESSNGNMKSMVGFQDMTPWLSGSTINAMWLYAYAEHWWNGSGGYPVIGAHPNLAGTFVWPSGANSQFTDVIMARGEGRWIQLPSAWYGGFITGGSRGIVFGPGWDNNSAYYGRFDAPSLRIRVNYTK